MNFNFFHLDEKKKEGWDTIFAREKFFIDLYNQVAAVERKL